MPLQAGRYRFRLCKCSNVCLSALGGKGLTLETPRLQRGKLSLFFCETLAPVGKEHLKIRATRSRNVKNSDTEVKIVPALAQFSRTAQKMQGALAGAASLMPNPLSTAGLHFLLIPCGLLISPASTTKSG